MRIAQAIGGLLIAATVFTACSKKEDATPHPIVGTWQGTEAEFKVTQGDSVLTSGTIPYDYVEWTFGADNSFKVSMHDSSMTGTYTITDTKLSFDYAGAPAAVDYTLDANDLSVYSAVEGRGTKSETTINFKRK